jgi:ferrochelatase
MPAPSYFGRPGFRHHEPERAAVLLVNLGTPAAPTAAALRRYLAEFLSDPRVVEAPRWLWRIILHGIVLRFRPRRSAAAYAAIWGPEGSPLAVLSEALRARIAQVLGLTPESRLIVALAMRYGEPSIPRTMRALAEAGVRRLLVLPLYPQYSATTAASVFDAVAAELMRWRWLPQLRFLTGYHDEPAYQEALAASVREAIAAEPPQALLCSFHGIPKRYFDAGDPYFCHCQRTARELGERFGWPRDRLFVGFQSRFGREPWLEPSTDALLQRLPGEGIRDLAVICPGFAVDCLETLEEIAIQGKERFLAAGGERFRYIPCLNDRPAHAEALAALIRRQLLGWPEAEEPAGPARAERERAERKDRFEREG